MGCKNKEDDPKVVFFLCFSLSPCNDFQLVAILYPNLIHYQSTRLYILGCKIGCLLCKTLIFNVYCGEDGIRTRGASCPARQFSKLPISPYKNLIFFQHFKQPIVCANVCYKNIFGKCSSDKFLEKITFFSKNVIFCNFCARDKKENRSKFWNGFGGEDGIRTRDTITCMLV